MMTRMTARQIAVQILFSMELGSAAPEDAMALFFSDEHYDSLKEEDELYREAPDEEHGIRIETVEDEYYITMEHPMTKDHYISFFTAVSSKRRKPKRAKRADRAAFIKERFTVRNTPGGFFARLHN